MNLKKLALFVIIAASAQSALAKKTSILQHEPSKIEYQQWFNSESFKIQNNHIVDQAVNWRPTAEVSDYKFVLMSSEAGFSEARNLRYSIAKNLPEGVKLVLLVENQDLNSVKNEYSPYISLDRVIFATSQDISNGFWARDAFPYPVIDSQNNLSLVWANYYRDFQAGDSIAQSLNLNFARGQNTFVGGNLMADEEGNCFTINSTRKYSTKESDLKNLYGCLTVTYLDHLAGIGDVDEVLKILPNKKAITNQSKYVDILKAKGFEVVMMPNISNSYRTYVNSLIVADTVFMPTYGMTSDAQAQKVYESFGYKVVGIKSNTFSDSYHGSVHCQTMAYPAISEEALLNLLNAKKLN